jgi:hypothetical protein
MFHEISQDTEQILHDTIYMIDLKELHTEPESGMVVAGDGGQEVLVKRLQSLGYKK